MQSLSYVAASNGVANASLMTVQTARAANATSIITNTVANAPQAFYATMGTPHTFTDPITGETITIISEATAVDFAGHLLSGHIEIDAIAPGYTDAGSKVGDIIIIRPNTEWANNIFNVLSNAHQDNGALKTTSLDAFYRPSEQPLQPSWIINGTGKIANVSALNFSFSDIIFYINGIRYTKTGVANRLYTASKDTYVDIDATGTLYYTEVANNTASPALTTGRIRVAIVVTGATTVTAINQGAVTVTLPQVNGNYLAVSDSLGNLIYCNSPNQKLIGYRVATAGTSVGAGGSVQVPGLSCPVIAANGRRVKIQFGVRDQYNNTAGQYSNTYILNQTSSYQVGYGTFSNAGGTTIGGNAAGYDTPPIAATTYQGMLSTPGSGTAFVETPAMLMVELD